MSNNAFTSEPPNPKKAEKIAVYGKQVNDEDIMARAQQIKTMSYVNRLNDFSRKLFKGDINQVNPIKATFDKELAVKVPITPMYDIGKRYLNLSKSTKLSKNTLWGKWFAPLKMWSKGGTSLMIKRIEKDILRGKVKITNDNLDEVIKKYSNKVEYLPWLAAAIAEWTSNDFDFMMAIIGYEGTGKSSLALALSRDLTYYGFEFNILTNVFFGTTPVDYIIDRIENSDKQIFLFDETDAFFDSRNSLKKDQKRLITSIVMNRARNHVYLLATPDISGIDIRFRERRITHILHLIDRNLVALLYKHSVGQTEDGFLYKVLQNRLRNKEPSSKVVAAEFAKLKTCYGLFSLDKSPITQGTYNLYKQFKMELNRMSAGQGNDISRAVIAGFLHWSAAPSNLDVLNGYSKKIKIPPQTTRSIVKYVANQMMPAKEVNNMFKQSLDALEEESIKNLLGGDGAVALGTAASDTSKVDKVEDWVSSLTVEKDQKEEEKNEDEQKNEEE